MPTSDPLLAQLTAFESLRTAVLSVSELAISRQSPTDKLLREALAVEAEEAQRAGALGFMARLLVQTTLPHRRQTSKTFVRTNGALKVSVSAHTLHEPM